MNVFSPIAPVTQPTPSTQTTTQQPLGQTAAPSGAVAPEAVKPTQQTNAEIASRDATAYAGKGAGAGAQDSPNQPRALLTETGKRPPDAAPASVLSARMSETDPSPEKPDPPEVNSKRREFVFNQADPDAEKLLPRPPLKLPDPLPTSPFLKPSGL